MPKVIRFLLLITLITGCKSKPTNNELEKQILYELFPAIVDATCIDVRKFDIPPPIHGDERIRFEEDGYPIVLDSTLLTREELNKLFLWQKEMDSLRADTSKLLIRFNPVVKPIKEDITYAQRFLSDTMLAIADTGTLQLPLKEDIIEGPFKITSDLKANTDNRLSISRILFNKAQTMGIIDVGFSCKGNCGKGYFVLIKKGSNGKWFISTIKQTWIA